MGGIIVFLLACITCSCVYQAYKTWAREDARERDLARVQMRLIEETAERQRNRAKREEIAENDQDLIDAGFTKAQIQESQRNARVHGVTWADYKKGLLQTQHYLRFPDERVKDMERSRNQEIQRSRERAGLE